MLLKSQELNLKKKDFFKGKIILLYGENQDLIKDLNEQILIKFSFLITRNTDRQFIIFAKLS